MIKFVASNQYLLGFKKVICIAFDKVYVYCSFSRIEPPQYMRVIYDFLARSNQELSIMKGEVVQVS